MNHALVTFTGNVVRDPETRNTNSGSVTTITVASTERKYDRPSQTYSNGVTTFYKVTCWRKLGERVAECLRQGDPVVVVGRLALQTFEKRDGSSGYSLDVSADAVGPDLQLT